MKTLGHRLKTLRRINNIAPEKVISLLEKKLEKKFSISSLYKWEEGIATPNIYIIIALSQIYHSSVSFIIDDTILKIENLTNFEASLLSLFRSNEHFMHLSMLMLKYYANN